MSILLDTSAVVDKNNLTASNNSHVPPESTFIQKSVSESSTKANVPERYLVYANLLQQSILRTSDKRDVESKEEECWLQALSMFDEPVRALPQSADLLEDPKALKEQKVEALFVQFLTPKLRKYSDRRSVFEKAQEAFSEANRMNMTDGERLLAFRNRPTAKKKTKVWHKFSRSLAEELNPNQPDTTAALVIYGLSLWMKTAERSFKKLSYCYRSLSELQEDHPYLSESGIEKAISRAEKKLKGDFKVIRQKDTMRFILSAKLRRRLESKSDEKLMFRIADAVLYGETAAILLSNLRWQAEAPEKDGSRHASEYVVDRAGNRYFELSPTKLSKPDPFTKEPRILPMHRDTITRALKALREEHEVIIQHPTRSTFYTLKCVWKDPAAGPLQTAPQNASTKLEHDAAKRDTCAAEVDTSAAERDTFPRVDSNEIVNEGSKVFLHHTATAAPSLCGVAASQSLRKLMELVGQDMKALASTHKAACETRHKFPTVPASQLPYDYISSPSLYLPYDIIPHLLGGKLHTHSHQVRDDVRDFASSWRRSGFRYKESDLTYLAAIFHNVPEFTADDFADILGHLIPNRIPIFGPDDFKKVKGQPDPLHFARKVTSATTLLKYLPELIEEMHTDDLFDDGQEFVRYSSIPEPFASVIEYCRTPKEIPKEVVVNEANPIVWN